MYTQLVQCLVMIQHYNTHFPYNAGIYSSPRGYNVHCGNHDMDKEVSSVDPQEQQEKSLLNGILDRHGVSPLPVYPLRMRNKRIIIP